MKIPSILIVEDEFIVAADLRNRLTRFGYRVAGSCISGEQAIEQVRRTRPDLVLMDIRLAGDLDGVRVAEEIRRQWDIPVVFLTGSSADEALERLGPLDPHGYILKPFEDRELRAVLEMALYKQQTRAALRESQQRFFDIVEASADWIWEVDAQGRYTYVSNNVRDLLGHEREDILGKTPFDLMPVEEAERVRALFADLLARRVPFRDLDNVNRHKDGSLRYIQTSGMPMFDDRGELIGYRGLDRDVTHHKRMEQALRRTTEHLRALLNTIPDLIWLKDPDGRYLNCNHRFEAFFGASEADILGKTDHDFLPPEAADFFRAKDQAAMAAGRATLNEEEVRFASDGHRELLQTIKTPMYDAAGQAIGVLGIARDITPLKRAELDLRRYQQVVETSGEMLLFIDRDLRYQLVNPAYARMFQAQPEDLRGRLVREVVGEELFPRIALRLEAALAGDVQRFNEDFTAPNGRYYSLEAEFGPFWVDGAVRGLVVSLHDVTELQKTRAALEAALVEARASAAAAEAASRAKSQFLSHMSHELRTPLNAILGFGQLLESDPDQPLTATQEEYLGEILKAGRHLLDLINEVLDLARIEAGRLDLSLEPVDLEALIGACLTLVGPTARQRGIRLQGPPALADALFVESDRLRLKQVLLNLLANAIKYGPPGGTVRVAGPRVRDGRVRVEVEDDGPGLSEDQQRRLFQPFSRLEEHTDQEGTGIGLALSQRLMELMGGRIGVDGGPGRGSRFWIELAGPLDLGALAEPGS